MKEFVNEQLNKVSKIMQDGDVFSFQSVGRYSRKCMDWNAYSREEITIVYDFTSLVQFDTCNRNFYRIVAASLVGVYDNLFGIIKLVRE